MGCTSNKPVEAKTQLIPSSGTASPLGVDQQHDLDDLWRRIEEHYASTRTAHTSIPMAVQVNPRGPLIARDALIRVSWSAKDGLKLRAGAIIDTCDRLMQDIQPRTAGSSVKCYSYALSTPEDEAVLPSIANLPNGINGGTRLVVQAGEKDLYLMRKLLQLHGFKLKAKSGIATISW
jgi:hypothetical protein